MGVADMLNQLGVSYDSKEGIDIITRVMEFITNAAYQASASLAGEKGASPIYSEDEYMECPFIETALSKATQTLIQRRPKVFRVNCQGCLGEEVTAKDLILPLFLNFCSKKSLQPKNCF